MWQQNIETRLGTMTATWSEAGLVAFRFAKPDQSSARCSQAAWPAGLRRLADQLAQQIDRYFEEGELTWSLQDLDWSDVSEFDQRILSCCASIPAGQTLTYGQLAQQAGHHGAARAVGGSMARNRWPILIPCHRVVGSDGKLTGYSGRGGTDTKRWLLEFERAAHCAPVHCAPAHCATV